MRVANLVPDANYNIQQSQQVLSAALQQVATGLRVNQPSDDPAAAANLVTSLAASANVDQYTKNISAVTSQLQTADSAFSSVVTSLNSALTLGYAGGTGTASTANRQNIASQVEGALSDVVAQANTSYQGVYVFAGSASSAPPVVAASTTFTTPASVQPPLSATLPLTAGSVTTITDATTGKVFTFTVTAGETISALSIAVSNAVAAGTLSAGTTAAFNSAGQLQISSNSSANGIVVSSNDPVLGAITAVPGTQVPNTYAYVGNSTVNRVQVGDSLNVAANLPGDQIFTAGANVIGALDGLITALKSGTSTQIQAATGAISTALSTINQQRVPLDNTISQLNSQESYLGQENVTLSAHQSSLVRADLAISATNLAQAETQNSAVLAATAKVLPQTLLNYLSH
jgi:flagellin-like hook-associated protein FlgL